MRTKKPIILLLLLGLTISLQAQQDLLNKYTDTTATRTYCLYPSTLRMLDPSGNPEYYALVSNVDKLLIYKLDTANWSNRIYHNILNQYTGIGYEPYITMEGRNNTLVVYGNEEGIDPSFVGFVHMGDAPMAFFLEGTVDWSRVPSMLNTLEAGNSEIINIFNLNSKKREHHPTDQQPD